MIVLLISCFFIGWLVGAKQEQKRQSKIKIVETMDLETKKVPPCVGHELESQKEEKRLSKKRVGRRN